MFYYHAKVRFLSVLQRLHDVKSRLSLSDTFFGHLSTSLGNSYTCLHSCLSVCLGSAT